ncbi:hypothetical protein, partial [Pseudacidovorax intermedius]|uniref:hypothetical protein n=1 Tax=Pseudacidovorax intermedius TaxID=433924 RepID=UPI001E4023C9
MPNKCIVDSKKNAPARAPPQFGMPRKGHEAPDSGFEPKVNVDSPGRHPWSENLPFHDNNLQSHEHQTKTNLERGTRPFLAPRSPLISNKKSARFKTGRFSRRPCWARHG